MQSVTFVEKHLHAPVYQTTLDFHQTADQSALSILSVHHILRAFSKSVAILAPDVAVRTRNATSSITTLHVPAIKVSAAILIVAADLPSKVSA